MCTEWVCKMNMNSILLGLRGGTAWQEERVVMQSTSVGIQLCEEKGKKNLQRFILSVDVAASVVGNLLLLLQPSVACKRGDSQLTVSREAVKTISPVPSSLEVSN